MIKTFALRKAWNDCWNGKGSKKTRSFAGTKVGTMDQNQT